MRLLLRVPVKIGILQMLANGFGIRVSYKICLVLLSLQIDRKTTDTATGTLSKRLTA